MSQTKTLSLVEQITAASIKFGWAMIVWQYIVAPYFGYDVTLGTNFQITCMFTLSSITIGFFIRRLFNWIDGEQCLKKHQKQKH